MTTPADTARSFQRLMETAAHGAETGRSERDCENKALAAMKVASFLDQAGYWGGPPATLEEAKAAAKRAWGDSVPEDVAAALSESEDRV